MTTTRCRALASAVAAIALLAPAVLASAEPVMTTSSDGVTFTIDITGGKPDKSVWFMSLPPGIDRGILGDFAAVRAAGARLASSGRLTSSGTFHLSFPVTKAALDIEY